MEPIMLSQITSEVTNTWQLFHGSKEARAHVVFGEKSLVVLLENAFSPAERKLAIEGRSANRLQKYFAAVLVMVGNSLKEELERIMHKKVSFSGQSMDLKSGWVMCVFQIGPSTP
jgi:uncharacterized protein YbcI